MFLVKKSRPMRSQSSSGMPVTPFISQKALFFAFGTQADANRVETVTVNPAAFDPALRGKRIRFIDMDTFEILNAAENRDGTFTFQLSAGAVSGRLVMVKEVER